MFRFSKINHLFLTVLYIALPAIAFFFIPQTSSAFVSFIYSDNGGIYYACDGWGCEPADGWTIRPTQTSLSCHADVISCGGQIYTYQSSCYDRYDNEYTCNYFSCTNVNLSGNACSKDMGSGGGYTSVIGGGGGGGGDPEPIPDFDIEITPTTQNVVKGNSAVYTIRLTPNVDYGSDTVSLSQSGCPTQSVCSISPSSLNFPNTRTATLTVSTTANTPTNTFSINITADSPNYGISHSSSALLTVNPPPAAPSVTFTADSSNIPYNTATTLRWTISNATSCTGTNMPAGNWSSGQTGNASTGNLTTTRTYTLNCTGSGGSTQRQVTVLVGAPPAACDTSPGLNFMRGCLYDGTNFNTLTSTSVNQAALSSPAPSAASPIPYRDWGGSGPDSSNTDTYSIRWSGVFNFSGGNYIFTIGGDDGVRLYVDGVLVVQDWSDHGYRTVASSPVSLGAGNHTLVMEYYENGGGAAYSLSWAQQTNPTTVSLSASPTSINSGQSSTLSWGISGTAPITCTGTNMPSGNWSSGQSGTVSTGNLTSNTTYSLNCSGVGGSASANTTVTVTPPPPPPPPPPATFNLNITTNGQGAVTPNPAGTSCGANCQSYPSCTPITITATVPPGRIFAGWGGDCAGTPKTSACSLTMCSAKNVSATFIIDPTFKEF